MRVYSPLALMQASNSGNRLIELRNALRVDDLSARDFARPLGEQFPITVKPGESAIGRVQGTRGSIELGEPRHGPWRTEIGYRRHGASEGFRRIWSLARTTGRQWLENMGLSADYHWASCGPVTNPLPYVPKLVSLTNYFLDLPNVPWYRKDDRPFNIQQLLSDYPPKMAVKYDTKEK